MSKGGRISYITSHAKQENLYKPPIVPPTMHLWNRQSRRKASRSSPRSGTTGKGVQTGLIIALPEIYTPLTGSRCLKNLRTNSDSSTGVNVYRLCIITNAKTNYHIHLIFSERKLLPEPDIKVPPEAYFMTKQEKGYEPRKKSQTRNGQVRKGCCTVIKKGEVYEAPFIHNQRRARFKTEAFIAEAKEVYTELINSHISDPEQRLKVFDKNSVYLPQKDR